MSNYTGVISLFLLLPLYLSYRKPYHPQCTCAFTPAYHTPSLHVHACLDTHTSLTLTSVLIWRSTACYLLLTSLHTQVLSNSYSTLWINALSFLLPSLQDPSLFLIITLSLYRSYTCTHAHTHFNICRKLTYYSAHSTKQSPTLYMYMCTSNSTPDATIFHPMDSFSLSLSLPSLQSHSFSPTITLSPPLIHMRAHIRTHTGTHTGTGTHTHTPTLSSLSADI